MAPLLEEGAQMPGAGDNNEFSSPSRDARNCQTNASGTNQNIPVVSPINCEQYDEVTNESAKEFQIDLQNKFAATKIDKVDIASERNEVEHAAKESATTTLDHDTSLSEEASENLEKHVLRLHITTANPETPPEGPFLAPKTQTQETARKTYLGVIHFEIYFVGLASVSLLCYCMAHIAIYELLYAILLELTEMRVHNLNLLYSGLMVTGVTLLRCTGFLWYFLSSKRFRKTRAELKQRRKQGFWDAQLYDWFDERPCLKTTVEVVAFYMCYIAVTFFWAKFLTYFFDQRVTIFQQLPSAMYREKVANDTAIDEALDGACPATKNWDAEDFSFLYHTVAKSSYYQYSGYLEAPLFSATIGISVYVCAAGLSIYLLSKLGLSFVDNW